MRLDRFLMVSLLGVAACGDDDEPSGRPDAGGQPGKPDAGEPGEQASAERGKYLADHVSVCIDCHTPRRADGSFDETRYLAGVECFIDINGAAMPGGCIHTANLTNHPTGLSTRSDLEIESMIRDGKRPNGEALLPLMPYWIFHNMTEVDIDSIVLHLRTVPGVDHTVPASDPPFIRPATPAPPLDPDDIPRPTDDNERTRHGRYLAGIAGACIDCHTALTNPIDFRSIDTTKIFAGGRAFPRDALGLPPVFPETIYSMNLTPDPTGIAEYDAREVVRVLHEGVARDGTGVCPPMPAGPMAAFGGLTDEDASDIGAYIDALPPVANTIPNECSVPLE